MRPYHSANNNQGKRYVFIFPDCKVFIAHTDRRTAAPFCGRLRGIRRRDRRQDPGRRRCGTVHSAGTTLRETGQARTPRPAETGHARRSGESSPRRRSGGVLRARRRIRPQSRTRHRHDRRGRRRNGQRHRRKNHRRPVSARHSERLSRQKHHAALHHRHADRRR